MEPVARNILQNLSDLKLITNRDIVNGSTTIVAGRQRNRFFAVKQLTGPSFFIKQAHEAEAGTVESIALEAGIYQAVSANHAFRNLRHLMPRLLHFDAKTSTLTLELIKDAIDIGNHARQQKEIHPDHARSTGEIAANFHSVARRDVDALQLSFDGKPHWIFCLDQDPSPLPSLRGRSKASPAIIDLIRDQPDLKACLARCRKNIAETCLIHGDFKWENFLITSAGGRNRLKLIDWERTNIGDPAWDVGCGLAAFFIHQILQPNADQNAKYDLKASTFINGMNAFWTGYVTTRNYSNAAMEVFREHCLDMAAARMLVAAYEHCYAQDQIPAAALEFIEISQQLSQPDKRQEWARGLSGATKAAA
ncbi:phosphotransferase [Thalassobius sp. I31.1]|uniref:phosphotransferase n=1 Tax=Thalassobius sp. I31.1 TaxID=2109912 RepID=UPI000D1B0960|nr:phosphotransferase [Thalassobius sp. I31.1]